MEQLINQMGESAGLLVLLIPPLVQVLKKIPLVNELQKAFPVYDVASIALGVGGAFLLGIPVPIVSGIVAGLAAGKGYDMVKKKGTENADDTITSN
jgi:hypothetical protein